MVMAIRVFKYRMSLSTVNYLPHTMRYIIKNTKNINYLQEVDNI